MMLRCEETSDALAAFAVDALEAEERLAVLEHLAECREHDDELRAHREAAETLPLTLQDREPPARLRQSLLDAFDLESAGSMSAAAVRPRSPGLLDVFRRPLVAYGIAALLLAALLAVSALSLSSTDNADQRVATVTTEAGLSLKVVYLPDEELAVLDVDLPEAPEGYVYQAWQVHDGQTVSLGLLDRSHGSTAFTADLGGASAVAISVEPEGGSEAPTTEPVISSAF